MEIPEIKQYVEKRLIPKLKYDIKRYELKEIVENTNVNFVYRLTVTDSNGKHYNIYLKHAKEFVKKLPHMKLALDRQNYEAKSLKIFHEILGDKVPEAIDLDEDRHILAITDVEHGTLLADLFSKNIFYPEAWKDFAKSLAKFHAKTYNKDIWIRSPEANQAFYDYLLPFRYMGALALAPEVSKKHLEEAQNEKTSLIYADPLRKNIFQTKSETYFFDFEGAGRYEPGYDIGYALAELVVESLNTVENREKVHACILKFTDGYSAEFEPKNEISHILHRAVKHMGAIILHRTFGPKEKNSNCLDFDEKIRKKLMDTAVDILNSGYKTPLEAYEQTIYKMKTN